MGLFDTSLTKKKAKQDKITKNAEDTANGEISEVLNAFKGRADGEKTEKASNTSTEFWCALYFADQEQRDEFLQKVGALKLMDDQYINGESFARKLGIELTPKKIKKPKAFRMPKSIGDLIGF